MKIIITESQLADLSEKLEVELQRGFGAWFDFTTEEIMKTPKKKVPMEWIRPNQPVEDEQYQDYQDTVDKIIADYKKRGTLMPLLVFKDGKKYTIIDGHHRWTAAKQLGKKTMVCHIIPKENIKLVHKWDKNGKELNEAVKFTPEIIERRYKEYLPIIKQFSNPKQLHDTNRKVYYFLRGNNLLDRAFPNRKRNKPDFFWTAEEVTKEASKYDTPSIFARANQVAYNAAREYGIMDFLFPSDFRASLKGRNLPGRAKLTLDGAIEQADNFEKGTVNSRTKFIIKHPTATAILKQHGMFDDYFPKLKQVGKVRRDVEDIDTARQYANIKVLRADNPLLYNRLSQAGVLKDIFPNKYDLMSYNELIDLAKTYKSQQDFRKNNYGAFGRIIKTPNGVEDLSKIFPVGRPRINTTSDGGNSGGGNHLFDTIRNAYGDKYELQRKDANLYYQLKRKGVLDVVFPKR